MPFDKSMPFGVNYGCPAPFSQGGKLWDAEGNEVDIEGNLIAKAPKAKAAPKVEAPQPKAAPARPAAAKAALDSDGGTDDGEAGEDPLVAWAKGAKIDMPFFAIKKAVAEKYGKMPANKAEAQALILGT